MNQFCRHTRSSIRMERIIIDLFKTWVRGKVTYTGRTKNANKMLRVLPLFQGFVRAHTEFFKEHGYEHRGRAPGQLAPFYALFRDRVLLQALTELRDDLMRSMGQDTDLPPLRYIMKRTLRRDGVLTPRAVCGWEARNV